MRRELVEYVMTTGTLEGRETEETKREDAVYLAWRNI